MAFRKSTHSSGTNHCVEVDREFRLSSHTADSGTCVAVARGGVGEVTAVRNSKDPDGPCVHFTNDEWLAFVKGVKDNEFD